MGKIFVVGQEDKDEVRRRKVAHVKKRVRSKGKAKKLAHKRTAQSRDVLRKQLFRLDVAAPAKKKERKGPYFPIGDSPKFSIQKLIQQVMGPSALRPADVVLDDSHIPEAPNFVEFMNGPEFMNEKLWARQNEIGVKLFSDFCPRCTNMEWFFSTNDSTKLSVPVKCSLRTFKKNVQLLEFGKCPKCKATRLQMIASGELKAYDEMIGVAGQRASKSKMVAGMFMPYLIHRFLKINNPMQALGLLRAETLHITFVALTYDQAVRNLWQPFYVTIKGAPWFKAYHAFLDAAGERMGEELYRFKDTFLLYRYKGLQIYPSGPNKRTLRGATRLAAAIDELGWFDFEANNNKERTDAQEVYIALKRSLATVRAAVAKARRKQRVDLPQAMMTNITSPSSPRDKAMMLLRESANTSGIFGFHHATWEINPEFTKDDFKDEFLVTPMEAERDYGANPPLSVNPLFQSQALLFKAATAGRNRCALRTFRRIRTKDNTKYTVAQFKLLAQDGAPSIVALDAGSSLNSFAFAVIKRVNGIPQVPIVGEVAPKPGYKINFSALYKDVLTPLIKLRNCKLLVADRWQSLKMLHDAEAEFNIKTQTYSLTYDDMILVRDHINDGAVGLPKPEIDMEQIATYDPSTYPDAFHERPVAHFYLQMMTVVDTGKQVIKGDGLTDDMWRAVALGLRMALDEDVQALLNQTEAVRSNALGVVAGKSGSSAVAGAAGGSRLGTTKGRSGR